MREMNKAANSAPPFNAAEVPVGLELTRVLPHVADPCTNS
jgi:hypothetical protein